MREAGVEALAISFLNSYLTPDHEQAAAAEMRRLLPDVFVTTGTELTREWHEFERTATAAANAYVGPQVSKYIAEFDSELRQGGFTGSLLLMGSHGGVISAERGCREPITLVESGPVGGCIGAASYGHLLGVDNLVAFDMGGTTAKCAMIERGRYAVESIYHIGGPDAGFPIRGNVIDILEVGVGGGSIAWLDDQRRLNVGPRSAGSMPGPACYGRGGTEPAVTDANLVLGRLDPGNFLGGEMRLEASKAARGSGSAHCRAARLPRRGCGHPRGQGRADHRQPDDVVDHQEGLNRARLRSARLRAVLLRRRRAAARHRTCARTEDSASDRPAGAGQFLGSWHAAG